MGMMINRRRVMGGKSLPYDAEIEYLKSSGTQYINTGYVPSTPTKAECAFRGLFNNKRLFGCRRSSARDNQFDVILYDTSSYGIIFRIANSDNYTFKPTQHNAYYELSFDNAHFTVNGVTTNISRSSYNSVYPLILFGFNNGGSIWLGDSCTAEMYYFKLYEGNVLILDFIPVRVGQVGYMYDKVSGTLFGNAGTGSFILGPDI